MDPAFTDTSTVTANGTALAYAERGTGEPVVFAHGALSDLRTWTAQLEAVGERHRAIAYSARYARPNDDIPPGADNPMHVHVEDLAALVRALDAAPAHLVGNSSGAFVCLLTAIRHPDVVRTLTLEEPPVMTLFVSPTPTPGEMGRLFARRPRTAAAVAKMGATALMPAERAFRRGDDEAGMEAFARGVLGREHLARLSGERRRQARENVGALHAMLVGDALPELSEDEVRGVRARTLLLAGAESPAFGHRLIERLAELLPDATLVEVPHASHLMHEDNAPAVNEMILDFIAGAGATLQ